MKEPSPKREEKSHLLALEVETTERLEEKRGGEIELPSYLHAVEWKRKKEKGRRLFAGG